MSKPQVLRMTMLAMQVCVPKSFDDEQVEKFANTDRPAGTELGWKIRKEGHKLLNGDPERVQCRDHADCVHIMLEC